MQFEIKEIDPDYNAYVGSEVMEFATQEDADAYCRMHSWSGARYYAVLYESEEYDPCVY